MSKDPAIKLFGRNISVPDIQIPAKPPYKNRCSDITKGEIVGLDKSAVTDQIRVEENEGSNSSSTEQEKFKKPDKILPCPRCNSLDTKFCYFNNYNVNQPRHFCKNCQRYWTAGGTMRNVPIGAGRRRNKHLASQYRQILVSPDGIPMENSESENNPVPAESSNNGMVMKFSSEAPLCESMEKTLSLVNNTRDKVEERLGGATAPLGGESLESVRHVGDTLKASSEAAAPHPQCYPVPPPPWLFPWAPGSGPQVQWPIIAVPPGFCPPPSNIPVQLVPASYCMPVFAAFNSPPSCSTSSASCCSGNGSPKLGKHSRDEEQAENCVLVPKTLRIDDLKSPPLGGKPEQKVPISNGSVFKNFETKCEGKSRVTEASPILEANPAALSRVNTFQESS